jgi:hypothetical protein
MKLGIVAGITALGLAACVSSGPEMGLVNGSGAPCETYSKNTCKQPAEWRAAEIAKQMDSRTWKQRHKEVSQSQNDGLPPRF